MEREKAGKLGLSSRGQRKSPAGRMLQAIAPCDLRDSSGQMWDGGRVPGIGSKDVVTRAVQCSHRSELLWTLVRRKEVTVCPCPPRKKSVPSLWSSTWWKVWPRFPWKPIRDDTSKEYNPGQPR